VTDEILAAFRHAQHSSVFVVGSHEQRVTIYRQQVRAHNLSWALRTVEELTEKTKVLVVGAGIAGLTVATSLAAEGASVTVVERQTQVLFRFRNTKHRILHPRVYDWPGETSTESQARLPLFDWSTGPANQVCAGWSAEWENATNQWDISVRLETDCSGLACSSDGMLADIGGETLEQFDYVVLCVGFGNELAEPSYWQDSALDSEQPGDPRRWLVAGVGDGGLIDTLRLTVRSFDIRGALQVIGECLTPNELEQIRRFEAGSTDDESIAQFYSGPGLNAILLEDLRGRLRPDTKVALVGRGSSPFTSRSSALNRFLIGHLLRVDGFEYVQDELCVDGGAPVNPLCFRSGRTASDHNVLVRIGPNPEITRFGTRRTPDAEIEVARRHWPSEFDFTQHRAKRNEDSGDLHLDEIVETSGSPPVRNTVTVVDELWPGIKYFSTRKLLALGVTAEAASDLNRRDQLDRYIQLAGQLRRQATFDELVRMDQSEVQGRVVQANQLRLTMGKKPFFRIEGFSPTILAEDSVVFGRAQLSVEAGEAMLYFFGSADNWTAGQPLLASQAPATSSTECLSELISGELDLGESTFESGSPEQRVKFIEHQLRIDRFDEQYIFPNATVLFEVDSFVPKPEDEVLSRFGCIGKLVAVTTL